MFTTKLLSLLLLVPNNLQNFLSGDSESIYIRFKNLKNINAGNDQRYYVTNNNNKTDNAHNSHNADKTDNTDNSDTLFMLHKIRRHIINKNIIEELENNNTTIHQNMHIIETYTEIYENQNKISAFNLLAGNLLNDFYDII
jgi:hypothetical protein